MPVEHVRDSSRHHPSNGKPLNCFNWWGGHGSGVGYVQICAGKDCPGYNVILSVGERVYLQGRKRRHEGL